MKESTPKNDCMKGHKKKTYILINEKIVLRTIVVLPKPYRSRGISYSCVCHGLWVGD